MTRPRQVPRERAFLIAKSLGTVVLLSSLLAPPPAATSAEDDSPHARYFSGLRKRGLFGVAEGVCLEQLARENLTPAERLETTLEFSRTLAEHAQVTSGTQQTDLWARATGVLDRFLKDNPQHDEAVRVEIQAGLVPLAHGGYLARLSDLAPLDHTRRASALEQLQAGITRLLPLQKRLANPGKLRESKRRQLLATTRWRLALAHLDRARMMRPGAPDRAADLLAAEATLKAMSPHILGSSLRISRTRLQAQVARRQLDFTVARRILRAGMAPDHDELLAEAIWVELDDKQPQAAQELIARRLLQRRPPGDELRFLAQAVSSQLWRQALADGASNAETLWQEWSRLSEQAAAVPDAYWATRGRQDARLMHSIKKLGESLALAEHRAMSLYQAGRLDESLEAFDRAITGARSRDRPDLSGELAFTRGSVLVRAGRFAQAATQFSSVASQQPPHDKAASAHLLHAWCLGQLLRKMPSRKKRLAYRDALERHRKRFPGDDTTAEATWWLASLSSVDKAHGEARSLWMQIPRRHRRGPASRRRVAESFEVELAGLARQDPGRPARVAAAVRILDVILDEIPERPRPLQADHAHCLLSASRIRLQARTPDYQLIDSWLNDVLARGPHVSPSPRATPGQADLAIRDMARQLRVLSLAGQGKIEQARSLITSFAGRPIELLALLDGLDGVASHTPTPQRRKLGSLQLQAAESLATNRQQLDRPTRRKLDRCLAAAFVAAGFPLRAVSLYEDLVERQPQDHELRVRLAQIRGQINSTDQKIQAVKDWRIAESLVKTGSDDWMSARVGRLEALRRSGQLDQCRRLLQVTRLLYPDLGTPETKSRLKTLEQLLKPAAPR